MTNELRVKWPCLGTVGSECESLDADRLPALIGLYSVRPIGSAPCDNCMQVDFEISHRPIKTT